MTTFSFCKTSRNIKIRYIKNSSMNDLYIVFLHGFMSDLEGKKPMAFLNFTKKHKLGFLALEYSGHGKSSGKFVEGNISKWSSQTKLLIQKIVKRKKLILVGSSMGAWISLNQFKYFKNQIQGFIGIGSAPEFLENLMWKKFTKKIKDKIITKKISFIKHGKYEYPITLQLIKDGKKNKVLNKIINSNIKVTMVHGSKDESVPVVYSKKVLKIFQKAQKKLIVVKGGDHSLSSPKNLKIIKNEISLMI